jgi:tRNA1Val (adenine37-N6)-methyltransferase
MSKHKLFRFKHFNIDHSQTAMKVGTDGVLLGAWTNVDDVKAILEIGTGSGVIALMLAQRSSPLTLIDAVEVESKDSDQAKQNVADSPWPEKVQVFCAPVQVFDAGRKYDLIVTNPPFFSRSYEPPNQRRLQTRHTELLSFEDLLSSVVRLLSSQGRFCLILPPAEALRFSELALNREFHCTRKWTFRTRANKPVERVLMEFSRKPVSLETGEILLYITGDDWSEEYRRLTRDFYLQA